LRPRAYATGHLTRGWPHEHTAPVNGLRERSRGWLAGTLAAAAVALPARAVTVSNVVDGVQQAAYRTMHAGLSVGNGMNRGFTGTTSASVPRVPAAQHDSARDFIRGVFSNQGWQVQLDPFTFHQTYGGNNYLYSNCNNVVAFKPGLDGTNAQYHIVGAHYDSVDAGQIEEVSPGANDNGSGTAAVLALAKALGPYQFRDHIYLIAFDAEEKDLCGSAHYVSDSTTTNAAITNRILRSRIRGMITADMIAFNPAGANLNRALVYGGSTSSNAWVRTNLVAGLQRYSGLAVSNPPESRDWSDHESFRAVGVDACVLIEAGENEDLHYHATTDSTNTAGYIDYAYATKMTKGLAGYLCIAAGIVPPASVTVTGLAGRCVVRWDGAPGVREALEYRTDLNPGSWTALRAQTNVAGVSMCYTDAVSALPQRFYRVRRW
jgi:hypothetical protein